MVELGVNMRIRETEYICNQCYDKKFNTDKNIEKKTIHPMTAYCETCHNNLTSIYIYSDFNNLTLCCNKEMKLKLLPDYRSFGVWCFHCGCNLSILQLPDGLINLCEIWNNLWDHQINNMAYRDDEYFAKVFISSGKYLCDLINQYCYCEFDINENEILEEVLRERNHWNDFINRNKENNNETNN